MLINRSYNHREFGAIGEVSFETPNGKYVLNGTELPESSVEHLLTFALQTFQDAYAGAKDATEAVANFEKKVGRVIDGSLGTRGGGGVDEFTSVARQIVRSAIKAKLGGKSEAWANFTGLSDDEQNAKLDANFAANAEALTPAVNAEIERKKAARDAKRDVAKTVSFNL